MYERFRKEKIDLTLKFVEVTKSKKNPKKTHETTREQKSKGCETRWEREREVGAILERHNSIQHAERGHAPF